MSRREEALVDLLGVSSPVGHEHYPNLITLPEHVHQSMLSAIGGTAEDGRERSMHFRYRFNQWTGKVAVKGQKEAASYKGRVNYLHLLSTLIYPPHLHLHTHPMLSDDFIEAQISDALAEARLEILDDDTFSLMQSSARIQHHTTSRVPSSGDIFRSLKDPPATVAHLLGSQAGSFIWVHKNLNTNRGILANPLGSAYAQKALHARQMKIVAEASEEMVFDIDNPTNGKEAAEEMVRMKAQALSLDYVCYASEDIENPELKKIPA